MILYSAAGKSSLSEYEGVEIRSVPCGTANPYLRDIEFLIKALRDVRSQNADILHFHSLPEGANTAAPNSRPTPIDPAASFFKDCRPFQRSGIAMAITSGRFRKASVRLE